MWISAHRTHPHTDGHTQTATQCWSSDLPTRQHSSNNTITICICSVQLFNITQWWLMEKKYFWNRLSTQEAQTDVSQLQMNMWIISTNISLLPSSVLRKFSWNLVENSDTEGSKTHTKIWRINQTWALFGPRATFGSFAVPVRPVWGQQCCFTRKGCCFFYWRMDARASEARQLEAAVQ